MYNEMGKTGKKGTVHYLKLQYQNFSGGTETNHGKPKPGYIVPWPRHNPKRN
jgi:hypothetical protein